MWTRSSPAKGEGALVPRPAAGIHLIRDRELAGGGRHPESALWRDRLPMYHQACYARGHRVHIAWLDGAYRCPRCQEPLAKALQTAYRRLRWVLPNQE